MLHKLTHLFDRLAMFQMVGLLLLVFPSLLSSDGRCYFDPRSGAVGPGTTSSQFCAGTTLPDAHSTSFHLDFATEGKSVLGVLGRFRVVTVFLREAHNRFHIYQ